MIERLLALMVIILLPACGTMVTLTEGPLPARETKYAGSQPCESINRIYAGVKYDYCVVSSGDGSGWELEGYLFWDFPFSFLLDTVVLPYSIYKQVTYGDLKQDYKN